MSSLWSSVIALSVVLNISSCQIFPSHWQSDGCIPSDEYISCISLVALNSLHWIRNQSVSHVNIEILSNANTTVYRTESYRIDNTNSRSMNSVSTCWHSTTSSLLLNIYNSTDDNNWLYLASHTINLANFNLSIHDSPIRLTEPWQNFSDNFDISAMSTTPNLRYLLWSTSSQCLEITTSAMFLANDYNLHTTMYRLTNDDEVRQSTAFQTSKFVSFDASPTFNALFCLPRYPANESEAWIAANFTLNDRSTQRSYSLSRINGESHKFYKSAISAQSGSSTNTLHFAMGNVQMNYWQSCSLMSNEDDAATILVEIASDTMMYTLALFALLLFIIFICMLSGCYTCSAYTATDPIRYGNVLWFLLLIWDFLSQVLFAAFLGLQINKIDDAEAHYVLLVLFAMICAFLLLSYLCNLLYLIHYLQIWNDSGAPGVTRHWLELWSWLVIFITMTMGGVHVALELCNSTIIPIDMFCMHLSHSELVRTRKDKWVSNVLLQDIPILVLVVAYIMYFHSEQVNVTQDDILLMDLNYLVVTNAFLATLISATATSFFRFLRRNYSHDNPVAEYQFSLTLKSNANEWQSYWVHSHRKIQKCFKQAFDLRKLSLTIIDQCSESLNAMKIEGRILKDAKSQTVQRFASHKVSEQEIREIGLKLLTEFKKQFKIVYAEDAKIDHLTIKPISNGGQMVYNHGTCVQILCVGLKDCCKSMGHQICPSCVTAPISSDLTSKTCVSEMQTMQQLQTKNEPQAATQLQPPPVAMQPGTLQYVQSLPSASARSNREESVSRSGNALPMITLQSHTQQQSMDDSQEAGADEAGMDAKSSYSMSNNSKALTLDQHVLFADVYRKETGLSELREDAEETPTAAAAAAQPPKVPSNVYAEMRRQMKQRAKEQEEASTDQFGFQSSSVRSFASVQERVKQLAGDAPASFSQSARNMTLTDNASQHQYFDDEDIDI